METIWLSGTKQEDICVAGDILRTGGVVAIPTETVYGLAADATNPAAVADIFAAKGRPQDNPLIVHISVLSQLSRLCRQVPQAALQLAEHFWPGPLTMILPKSEVVPDVVSAGLKTVGVRMPSHPVARAIIDAAGVPLAAPSANSSGRPSPTRAEHVLQDMQGKIPAIVDGGACQVGVESTIVDLSRGDAKVLRPGAITEEMIAAVLGSADTDVSTRRGLAEGERALAPGMKYRHYAPKAPVLLFEGAPEETFAQIAAAAEPDCGIICFDEYADRLQTGSRVIHTLGSSWDFASHARTLFDALRAFDSTSVARIYAQSPRTCGVNAATVNRLRKAAGFCCTDCSEGKLVIGVTGRSGSGKSVFGRVLTERGALSVDADAVYRRLLAEDTEMIAALLRRFPEADENGAVHRGRLAQLVFSDAAALADLNAITHPVVVRQIRSIIAQSASSVIVLDVPLLFESALDRLCHITVGVLAEEAALHKRIMERDTLQPQQAQARLASQPQREYYAARCDILLENRGTLPEFEKKIHDFYEKYVTDPLR